MTTIILKDCNYFFELSLSDRNPTATEPTLSDNLLVPEANFIIVAKNEATQEIFYLKGGSNGSYVWISLSGMARSFNNSPSHSIVSVAAAANGFQVSSTRDSIVNYSVTITTAVQIGLVANVDGYVVLEIASTNSATAGDWAEIGRTPQAQNVGLALALSSTQKGGGQVGGVIPAGYFGRLRSINTAGTPTYAYNSGQEVLL